MLVEESDDQGPQVALLGLQVECVRGALDDDQLAVHADLLRRLVKACGLVQRCSLVGRTVQDQQGWIVLRELLDRGGRVPQGRCLGLRRGEHRQGGIWLGRDLALPRGRAVWVHRHRRLDAAGVFRILQGIEAHLGAADRQQRSEMAARRATDRTDVIRIELEPLAVLPQPAHRPLAVLNVPRKGGRAGFSQGIVDRQADVAVGRERSADVDLAAGAFVAAGPPAAMNDHDSWVLLSRLECRRQVEIRFLRPVRREIRNVLFHAHRGRLGGDLAHEQVPPADFTAVRLQHDRALGRQRLRAVPVVLHHGAVHDELVVQPHPGTVADLANTELVPFAEGLVRQHQRIAAGRVGAVVEQSARSQVWPARRVLLVEDLSRVPDLYLRSAPQIDATVGRRHGLVLDQKLDVAELFVRRGIGPLAVVHQFAVLDRPVLRKNLPPALLTPLLFPRRSAS